MSDVNQQEVISREPVDWDEIQSPVDRPNGIAILAVLHALGGIALIILQIVVLSKFEESAAPLRSIGIPPAMLMIAILFLGVLNLAASVGLFSGAKWGWWIGSFYYVYSIARALSALATVFLLQDQFDGEPHGPEYYATKFGGRAIVHFLIYLYFFKQNVLAYFGMQNLNKPRAVGIQVAICSAIAVLFNVWLSIQS